MILHCAFLYGYGGWPCLQTFKEFLRKPGSPCDRFVVVDTGARAGSTQVWGGFDEECAGTVASGGNGRAYPSTPTAYNADIVFFLD